MSLVHQSPMNAISTWDIDHLEHEAPCLFDAIDAAMAQEMGEYDVCLDYGRQGAGHRDYTSQPVEDSAPLGCVPGKQPCSYSDICDDMLGALLGPNELGEKEHLSLDACNFFSGEQDQKPPGHVLFQEDSSSCLDGHSYGFKVEYENERCTSGEFCDFQGAGVVPDILPEKLSPAPCNESDIGTVPELAMEPSKESQVKSEPSAQPPLQLQLSHFKSLPLLASLSATLMNLNQRAMNGDNKYRARREGLARYRAKKARRMFSKKIRYQLRKINADKRPRIKGRFVKKDQIVESLSTSPTQDQDHSFSTEESEESMF